MRIERHRTALARADLSRPTAAVLEHGIVGPGMSLLDYGCGRGGDVERLAARGFDARGWDPVWRPDGDRTPADIVLCNYVVNVIEDSVERTNTVLQAWTLAREVLVVAARLTWDMKGGVGQPYGDGFLSARGTFQRYYEQGELRSWLGEIVGSAPVAAAPGIFFIFKNREREHNFLLNRARQQVRLPGPERTRQLFAEHRELMSALMEFLATRGRPPASGETPLAEELRDRLGSVQRAVALLRRNTGHEQWDDIAQLRAAELSVHFGTLLLSGERPRLRDLPASLKLDVRAFFGSLTAALQDAERLLFGAGKPAVVDAACRLSPVGKMTPAALYVHDSARASLPPVLRAYEACARAVIGDVPGANVVKLHRREAKVSFLEYPDFEQQGHPALVRSTLVHLETLRAERREFGQSRNPPVLHRKEEFVDQDHPLRDRFARLTKQEERAGLFAEPERIGTTRGWEQVLSDGGYVVRGHRLVRTAALDT